MNFNSSEFSSDSRSMISSSKELDSLLKEAQQLQSSGATCDTYVVKVHGKLMFIKRLKEEYRNDSRFVEAMKKEFEIGWKLRHRSLPNYIQRFNDAILMEYIDGVTLRNFIYENPDYFENRKNLQRFTTELLECLDYIHSQSVLHLDLKPDNIIISRVNKDVRLIDFGFAYTDTFADTIGLNREFSAPEQIDKSMRPDARADIYATGRIVDYILYECGQSFGLFKKFVEKATQEDVDDRFFSAEEALQFLTKSRRPLGIAAAVAAMIAIVAVVLLSMPSKKGVTADATQQTTDSTMVDNADSDNADATTTTNEKQKPVKSKQEGDAKGNVAQPTIDATAANDGALITSNGVNWAVFRNKLVNTYKPKYDEMAENIISRYFHGYETPNQVTIKDWRKMYSRDLVLPKALLDKLPADQQIYAQANNIRKSVLDSLDKIYTTKILKETNLDIGSYVDLIKFKTDYDNAVKPIYTAWREELTTAFAKEGITYEEKNKIYHESISKYDNQIVAIGREAIEGLILTDETHDKVMKIIEDTRSNYFDEILLLMRR